jgi:hypothetical protein
MRFKLVWSGVRTKLTDPIERYRRNLARGPARKQRSGTITQWGVRRWRLGRMCPCCVVRSEPNPFYGACNTALIAPFYQTADSFGMSVLNLYIGVVDRADEQMELA